MATQTFLSDIQAMNPTSVTAQQVQNVAKVQQTGSPIQQAQVVQQQKVTASQSATTVGQGQTTTIIQPAQAHTGGQQQSYIVTSKQDAHDQYLLYGDDGSLLTSALNEDQGQETVTIQQGNGQTVYPQVQYLESNDHTIYASANGQMQSTYPEYSQTTMYAPVSGTYYQTAGSQAGTPVTQIGVPGQIITHQGGTFLVQQGTMDGEGTPLGHTTRASPATVQWLIDNYETAEGVSLPRSTLYNHYLRHCQEQNLDPMNPASFGKLIRSVFLGLRTRRLGTRGNSKYHYYGIRIKAGSALNQYTDDQTMAMRQQPLNQGKWQPSTKVEGDHGYGGSHPSGVQDAVTTQQQQHQQYLGDASGAIPNFGEVDLNSSPLPENISQEHIKVFEKLYREHAESILDVVVNLQFTMIEALWQGFWRHQPSDQLTADNEYEKRLPKEVLYAICKLESVQSFVRKADYAFYQTLVKVLIPDVLRPIPSSLTQAIRNFAKSLENWLKGAMQGVTEEMVKTKIGAVSAFAQTLRRYTSLNHLAQAARAVLQNTSQITQMLTDLNRVDFANVQEQASWVCQCEDAVVHQLEQDFKKTLQQQNTLEEWAVWLEGVVNQVLKPHEGSPNFPKAARQFLLKWSFYSSMVIRDLTLRSAASFGSFHLIRLLYDEFMFYLVEHKVAAATGETPIAVMGEVRQFIDLGSAVAMSSLEAELPALKPNTTPSATVASSTGGTLLTQLTTAAPSTLANTHSLFTGNVNTTQGLTNLPATVRVSSVPSTAPTAATTHAGTSIISANAAARQASNSGMPNNTTTVTVLASGATNMQGAKTIVVLPVSAASGAGEPTIVKRMKTE